MQNLTLDSTSKGFIKELYPSEDRIKNQDARFWVE